MEGPVSDADRSAATPQPSPRDLVAGTGWTVLEGVAPPPPAGRAEASRWATVFGTRWPPGAQVFLAAWTWLAGLLFCVQVLNAPSPTTDVHQTLRLAGLLLACGVASGWILTRTGAGRVTESASSIAVDRVWVFASILVLPTTLAMLTIAATAAATALWRREQRGSPPRLVFSLANLWVSAFAASQVFHAVTGAQVLPAGPQAVPGVITAAVTFEVVYAVGAVVLLLLRDSEALVTRRHASRVAAVNAALLSYGAVAAWVAATNVWLLAFAFPPLLLLCQALLHDETRRRLRTDDKTKVASGTWWREEAERVLAQAAKHEHPASILVVDIDHFKTVNDTFGHLAGDTVLASVAATLSATVRGPDLVGRFGGEEFLVVLPGATVGDAIDAAQRLRRAVAAVQVPVVAGDGTPGTVHVTVSVGVAGYPVHGMDVDTVLRAADQAMYQAKHAGRDQVTAAP